MIIPQWMDKTFDTIVSLAVIEHISAKDVHDIFSRFKKNLNENGVIFLTTPTPVAKPVLEFLAAIGLLEKENIEEHKHYWTKRGLRGLAEASGFYVTNYKKFQLGFNQYLILRHKTN